MLETVSVPPHFEPIFAKAEEQVRRYFEHRTFNPAEGTIEIFGQRYILVRSAAMSIEFFEIIKNIYQDQEEAEAIATARNLLFDIAHAIGITDARNFHGKMDVTDPIEKLSAGPVHFAHTGWAFVDISADSRPTPDEDFYLIYDHPYSFEASSWVTAGVQVEFPVCVMNAGYSSGWCEESFGIPLIAIEILCRARGDAECRFIMAQPHKISSFISDYYQQHPDTARQPEIYNLPGFFVQKKNELQAREAEYRSIFEAATDAFLIIDMHGAIVAANPAAHTLYGYPDREILSVALQDTVLAEGDKLFAQFKAAVNNRGQFYTESLGISKSKATFDIEIRGSTFTYRGQPHLLAVVRDITGRKRAEADRLRLEAEISALSTPLIPISSQVVLMPLIGSLNTQHAEQFIEILLHGIVKHRAQIAILDITGVPVVDSQIANALIRATKAAQLVGTKVILTGIRPEVAQTLVNLGVDLSSITTHGSLQNGITFALQQQMTQRK